MYGHGFITTDMVGVGDTIRVAGEDVTVLRFSDGGTVQARLVLQIGGKELEVIYHGTAKVRRIRCGLSAVK